ncbi:MAG TPA: hypothetical protein VKA54_14170 [Gemmatimonadaceae bacterium]|nr:hypothetical protein [Gemmatimonadaceae bacterium]
MFVVAGLLGVLGAANVLGAARVLGMAGVLGMAPARLAVRVALVPVVMALSVHTGIMGACGHGWIVHLEPSPS